MSGQENSPEEPQYLMRAMAMGDIVPIMCEHCLSSDASAQQFFILTDDGVVPSLCITWCRTCYVGIPPCSCCDRPITDDTLTQPRWRSERAAWGVCHPCRNSRCTDDHEPRIPKAPP